VYRLALATTIAAVVWTLTLLAAPVAISRPPFAAPAAVAYAASSRVCHQRPERSLRLAGMQMPVCARCFGLYLSGALGALAAWGSRRRPGDRARIVLAVAAAPTALTWAVEAAGLVSLTSLVRLLAALPLGLVAGWLFVQMLRYDSQLDGHQISDRRARTHGG
jgi:uncharacterized membrane protein